ncbi:MAG TPA: OmpA family protein [Bacteroidia bacterium]|nr:OmpA family protein [Bacteroidia bacterium]
MILLLLVVAGSSPLAAQEDSVKTTITNLGSDINTAFEEYTPVISADGSIMLFTSRRPVTDKEKKKNKESKETVYLSRFNSQAGKWEAPSALPSPINVEGRHTSVLGLSNDGQRMLIYRDDETGNGNIWESHLDGLQWSEPELLPDPINSPYHESSASFSPDGRTLYFVSDRPGGLGGRDIWISTLGADGKWSTPINPGAAINTPDDEEGVFIHPDGVTLYFSSKGRGGLGGYDVYKSVRVNGMWTTAVSLGQPINTTGDDLFFVLTASGKKAYYSCNAQADNKGKRDLYEITFTPVDKKVADRGPRLTLLKGVITDSLTHQPLQATIQVFDNEKNELVAQVNSNSASGQYLLSLPSGKNYNITVSANNYLFHSENFNIPDTSSYHEVQKNIAMQKIEVGNKMVLNNIFFDYNKATLRPESYAELNNLVNLMKANPTLEIEISGHTDNRGTADYNKKLSQDRAKAVVDYLVSQGIDEKRLTYVGYGFDKPIATNDTDEGRQLNRRVEFKVLKK